jgi:hypothetical protein
MIFSTCTIFNCWLSAHLYSKLRRPFRCAAMLPAHNLKRENSSYIAVDDTCVAKRDSVVRLKASPRLMKSRASASTIVAMVTSAGAVVDGSMVSKGSFHKSLKGISVRSVDVLPSGEVAIHLIWPPINPATRSPRFVFPAPHLSAFRLHLNSLQFPLFDAVSPTIRRYLSHSSYSLQLLPVIPTSNCT